ncbi:mycothiol-dependent nitroreductase Rv2466c family protein [Leucobacter chinensis]|uniref:mycothiol-dependent nitroreductase Rv2466c family protein n=1 Tax=Leucobacter chinensis TaxID=2851010 RepID=UPI001C25059A|nr:DsbA family protein [Leucobacter chinensis]
MTSAEQPRVDSVEFWFDPVCPWAWMSSRWLTEVSEKLGLTVAWRPFSLAILNEGNEDDGHRDAYVRSLVLGKALIVTERDHGSEAVWRLYTELGNRLHHDARDDEAVLAEAVAAADLPESIANIAGDDADTAEQLLRASTAAGIEAVGPGVGVPILSINGKAFFGPVVTPRPKGQDALNLWNAVYYATQTPGFYELKRGREVGPDFS